MTSKEILVRQVDAFTTTPFAGNYAGVVPEGAGLSDTEMLTIAREMNVSETAFILPASQKGADLRIRWFTPGEEVPLCGHATIASFHLLAEEGRWGMERPGHYAFKLETRSGILDIAVDKVPDGSLIEFEMPVPRFRELTGVPTDILTSLGLQKSDVLSDLPTVSENYLYVPVPSLAVLGRIKPAYAVLADACANLRILGVCVFTLETLESSSAVHSRFFAPGLGVNEDPVTGSANGPLGVYLVQQVLTRGRSLPSVTLPDGRLEFIGEQGDEVERAGRVSIRVLNEGSVVRRVWIAGRAVTVMRGNIFL